MRTLPLTDAKSKLSDLVESVSSTHEAVTITRHGYPAAVLLSVEEFESMIETMAWTAEPGIHEDVAQARADIAEGDTMGLGEARASLARRRRR